MTWLNSIFFSHGFASFCICVQLNKQLLSFVFILLLTVCSPALFTAHCSNPAYTRNHYPPGFSLLLLNASVCSQALINLLSQCIPGVRGYHHTHFTDIEETQWNYILIWIVKLQCKWMVLEKYSHIFTHFHRLWKISCRSTTFSEFRYKNLLLGSQLCCSQDTFPHCCRGKNI